MAYVALPPEGWDSICRRVAESASAISWRWAALRETDGNWKFGALSATAEPRAERRRVLRYRNLILASETLAPDVAARRLSTGIVSDSARVPRLAFALPTGQLHARHRTTGASGPYRSHSGWPEFEVQHDSERAATGQQISNVDQLVEEGLPVYPSGADAVAHFVFGIPPEQRDLTRVGVVLIRLPDRRARIGDLRIVRGRIVVALEGELGPMHLRTYWRLSSQSTEPSWRDYDKLATRVAFPVRGVPYQVGIYLADQHGAVVDHRGWIGEYGDRPTLDDWEPARVVERIRCGEDEQTEFKQVVDKPSTHSAVARTVAGFANGEGGVIFIGVADDSNLIGADASVRASIDDAILQRVKPRPRYRWHALRVHKIPIQALQVVSGRPVIHRADGRVWIRAQGTTREAESGELQALAGA